jgi:hypothetical protein
MSDFIPKVWFIVYSIIRLILIVLCIVITVYASKAMTKGAVNVDPYMQVKSEWLQKPIVDIIVSTEPCQIGEKNLINYKWSGTDVGCWVDRGTFSRDYRVERGMCNTRNSRRSNSYSNNYYDDDRRYIG